MMFDVEIRDTFMFVCCNGRLAACEVVSVNGTDGMKVACNFMNKSMK